MTLASWRDLASAPASNRSHGSSTLSRVTQMTPKFEASSSLATASPHRAPASMSDSDSQGLT